MASQQIELPRLVDATDDRRPDIGKIIAQASFSVNLASPTPPQSRKRVTSPRMNKKLQKLQQKSSELQAEEVGHDKEIRDASAVVRDIENGMKIREVLDDLIIDGFIN